MAHCGRADQGHVVVERRDQHAAVDQEQMQRVFKPPVHLGAGFAAVLRRCGIADEFTARADMSDVPIERVGRHHRAGCYGQLCSQRQHVGIGLERSPRSDLSGKVLLTQAADSNELKLDLSNYSNGVYMVLIQTQSGTEMHRIVKK